MAKTKDTDHLSERIAELRDELKAAEPADLAARTGAEYVSTDKGGGELHLPLWGRPVRVSFPDFQARDTESGRFLHSGVELLLLYHFSLSDGAYPTGRWISFSELPDGRFYNQAFQGYTGKILARKFKNDVQAFREAAKKVSGQPFDSNQGFGDAAFRFEVLPLVPLGVVYWCGDEDFHSSCQILFDAAVSHHLPTDGCAILGSVLTHKILKV